jgi:hypothetical protein
LFPTVSSQIAQEFLKGVRKSICRSWWCKWTVYKVKMLILSKSKN